MEAAKAARSRSVGSGRGGRCDFGRRGRRRLRRRARARGGRFRDAFGFDGALFPRPRLRSPPRWTLRRVVVLGVLGGGVARDDAGRVRGGARATAIWIGRLFRATRSVGPSRWGSSTTTNTFSPRRRSLRGEPCESLRFGASARRRSLTASLARRFFTRPSSPRRRPSPPSSPRAPPSSSSPARKSPPGAPSPPA